MSTENEQTNEEVKDENTFPELKTISLKTRVFEANGHKYRILEKIPLSRYRQYLKKQPRLAYGTDFDLMFKNLKKAYGYLNLPQPRPADAAVELRNIMDGILDVEDDSRVHPALAICATFIVREDEDLGKFDDELARQKINDWAEGGYDVDGFFQVALISMQGFRGTFAEFIKKQMAQ